MKDSPIVEVEQLMFPSALDPLDAMSRERAQPRRGDSSLERRMQQLETRDRAPLRAAAQHIHGCFDFGQFGHCSWDEENETCAARTLTSFV